MLVGTRADGFRGVALRRGFNRPPSCARRINNRPPSLAANHPAIKLIESIDCPGLETQPLRPVSGVIAIYL